MAEHGTATDRTPADPPIDLPVGGKATDTVSEVKTAPAGVTKKSGFVPRPFAQREDPQLSDNEQEIVNSLYETFSGYYEAIPMKLKDAPSEQERCLEYLLDAEEHLTARPLTSSHIINARITAAKIEGILVKYRGANYSVTTVSLVVYLLVGLTTAGILFDWVPLNVEPAEFNRKLVMGIPQPVLIWAIIGSLTSMLLRAGTESFTTRIEAMRWFLYRPLVGVVMGTLTYLMLTAGLLVFAGNDSVQAPELIWVIAFLGSFSDTLSVNLLNRLIGRFQPPGREGPPSGT